MNSARGGNASRSGLNGGGEATRVAEWAGYRVRVLLRLYATCVEGGEQAARERVEQALRRA